MVTGADAAEGGPVPAAFWAATVNVYVVPATSPVTTRLVVGVAGKETGDCATPPMNGVTTYPVIGLNPLEAGGFQLSTACRVPAATAVMAGAPGTVIGTTALDAGLGGPGPPALT